MERLLRLPKVQERTGCGRSKIYKMIGDGGFPKPVKIDGCSVWPESEIARWIDARIAERGEPA